MGGVIHTFAILSLGMVVGLYWVPRQGPKRVSVGATMAKTSTISKQIGAHGRKSPASVRTS